MPPAEQSPRLSALTITLRRRSPWEAMDLGFTMLRRWWRPIYVAYALAFIPFACLVLALCWASGTLWLAMLIVWWLEPLYDRLVLHVLSRAVFGETPTWKEVWRRAGRWLGTGLLWALTFDRFDLARSFNLPVRQLEGSRGQERRARKAVLGRRTRSYAVWLTVIWIHFEAVLMWSADGLAALLMPAQAERARGDDESFFAGLMELMQRASLEDAIVYALVILALEPFYVAAGFALYLNRRTLLEGWDIELALRRIAEKHALTVLIFVLVLGFAMPHAAYAQEKNPKHEIAEVLKATEFGYQREVERWQPKKKEEQTKREGWRGWLAIGHALAKAAEVLLWVAAGGLIAYALWWAARMLPRQVVPRAEPYRPPPALFGMELAPETLPPDVGAAAAALARTGRLREALSLLYRGALSELVHRRGVRLLASHTEDDVLCLSGEMPYLSHLIDAWRSCAYARRTPPIPEVERLANDYKAAFA
ncbi:MAG TPA: hypothetical protein VFR66_13375 [Burkholderiales bacterium]|nr:hypothetical protein [Burkholderiales bacterium]